LSEGVRGLLFQLGERRRFAGSRNNSKLADRANGASVPVQVDATNLRHSANMSSAATSTTDLATQNAVAVTQQAGAKKGMHVMLSYNWGVQETVKKVKEGLEKAGFNVWMDIDQMAGSTLEAMANAVEQASIVLICYTKKYKESAACRTEAEYAFTLKKPIIPLRMEKDYTPDGWLGALLGSKLYHEFNSLQPTDFKDRLSQLVRELGDRGKLNITVEITKNTPDTQIEENSDPLPLQQNDALSWSLDQVAEWLEKIGLGAYKPNFQAEFIDGRALFELHRIYTNCGPKEFVGVTKQLDLKPLGHRLWFQKELRDLFAQ